MVFTGKIQPQNQAKPQSFWQLRRLVDIVLPPPSLITPVIGPSKWQHANWQNITFLDDPCCSSCGYPFEYDMGAIINCARCMIAPPAFDRARSAMKYDAQSSGIILAFKHGGKTVHLRRFARQMVRAGRPFWDAADILVPVPLHINRLRRRKFNQASLLASAIAKETDIPCTPEILTRHKDTLSQGTQSGNGRLRNVQGAFTVPAEYKSLAQGKNIVLVDDVYTTGATLESCARTLRRAGADQIFALTLSRVVKDQEIPT